MTVAIFLRCDSITFSIIISSDVIKSKRTGIQTLLLKTATAAAAALMTRTKSSVKCVSSSFMSFVLRERKRSFVIIMRMYIRPSTAAPPVYTMQYDRDFNGSHDHQKMQLHFCIFLVATASSVAANHLPSILPLHLILLLYR